MSDLQGDDHRKALEALRDLLAEDLIAARGAGSGTVAQLAAQYRATLAELAALPPVAAKSTTDEVKAQREKRRQAS